MNLNDGKLHLLGEGMFKMVSESQELDVGVHIFDFLKPRVLGVIQG